MSSEQHSYDFLVIGGGVGGIYSAIRAAQYGAKVALIEQDRLGGTCVNAGCAKKKIFWEAASIAETIRDSTLSGLFERQATPFAWRAFRHKLDAFITKINDMYKENLAKEGVHCIEGVAEFVDKNTVVVETTHGTRQRISAPVTLIATGSSAIVPTLSGAELGITSDGFFKLEEQPRKVAIVGEGYVAVELAGVFHALGTETHLLTRSDTVLKTFDPIIQDTLLAEYESSGIYIHKHAAILKVEEIHQTKRLHYENENIQESLDADCLIWAIGRVPRTKHLGLEQIGVNLNDKARIVVNNDSRTSVTNIYADGDVCDKGPNLTPVAVAAGTKLSDRLFGGQQNAYLDYANIPSVVFAHPPIGTVGLTENEARDKFGTQNVEVVVHKATSTYYWSLMNGAQYKPLTYKLVCAGRDRKIVGLHMIGRSADEMLQGLALAVSKGVTLDDLDGCVAIHPTASEEFMTAGKVGERRTMNLQLDGVLKK